MEFSFIDTMTIKAISRRSTPLWKIIRYWDAYDRSYPTYLEFRNSVNKLIQIGAIELNHEGSITFTNKLYKKMSIVERFSYLIQPSEDLILKVLARFTTKPNLQIMDISELNFEKSIQEYIVKAR